MKNSFLIAVAAVGVSLAPRISSAQAFASPGLTPTNPGVSCLLSSASLVSPMTFTRCLGSYSGNNKGSDANVTAVATAMTTYFNGFIATSVSSNDEGPISPFSVFNQGLSSGTLGFNSFITGPFVLALKAADSFSLYYYANTGVNGVNSVAFNTAGVTANSAALSHATLYRGQLSGVVPEPSTYALFATGLLGLGAVARRRRNAR